MVTPSTLALARRVRALLEAPERWTQGYFARDAAGQECVSKDPAAQCWCIVGAMVRLGSDDPRPDVEFINVLKAHLGPAGRSLSMWNDAPGRTHADVLALLDRVIAEGER